MKKVTLIEILHRFPYIQNIDCSQRFYGLIYELFEELEKINEDIIVYEISESFEALYLDIELENGYDIVDKYIEKSIYLCEICGEKEGKIYTEYNWKQSRCDECDKKYFRSIELPIKEIKPLDINEILKEQEK